MHFKDLYVVRHGESDPRGLLTNQGLMSINRFGSALIAGGRTFTVEDTVVLCSEQLRAWKTAQRIIQMLDMKHADPICHSPIFSHGPICDVSAVLEILRQYVEVEKFKTVIIVSHLEMVVRLPPAFWLAFLGRNYFPRRESVCHGQGWHIDCEAKTCDFIA